MRTPKITSPIRVQDKEAQYILFQMRDWIMQASGGFQKIQQNKSPVSTDTPLTISSHHKLTDLTNYDDHSQYLYWAGRTGGQTVLGGLINGELLTLKAYSGGVAFTVGATAFTVVSGNTSTALSAATLTQTDGVGVSTFSISGDSYLNLSAGGTSTPVSYQLSRDGSTPGHLFRLGQAGVIGIQIRNESAQSVDMTQWTNSTGASVLAKVDKDGNITAPTITATTALVGTWSGAVLETQITDGTLLARVAANETITGQWMFGLGGGSGGGRDLTVGICNVDSPSVGGFYFDDGSGFYSQVVSQSGGFTADRIITIPNGSGTIVLSGVSAQLFASSTSQINCGNGTLAGTKFQQGTSTTKTVQFNLNPITTARTLQFQDVSGTMYVSTGTDVAVADGGTGASTALAGFNALSPLTTKGDILTRDGTNNVRKAVSATDGQALVADSSQTDGLAWASHGLTYYATQLDKTADVALVALSGPTSGSFYVVHIWGRCKTAGNALDTTTINLTWNDGGSQTDSVVLQLDSTSRRARMTSVVYLASGTLNYDVTSGGGFLGTPHYDVRIAAIKLG